MTFSEAILTVLLSLSRFHLEADESDEHRRTRLKAVAEEIGRVAESRPFGYEPAFVGASLLTLGWKESRFALYVGEGRCSDGPVGARCDPDRRGRARARTYFQLHESACRGVWKEAQGSREELREATQCAFRRFVGALSRCRGRHPFGDFAGAFSGYRSLSCTWKEGAARARSFGLFYGQVGSTLHRGL